MLGFGGEVMTDIKFDRKPWVKRGDKVRLICRKQIFALRHRKNLDGRVVKTDGENLYVRFMWCKWIAHLYRCEVEKVG